MERRLSRDLPAGWLRVASVLATAAVLLFTLASRLLARQATIWEWDDVIFGVTLRVFAPQSQVPQPPYYPGFVFLGRMANAVVGNELLALTSVSVLSSCIALVMVYLLSLEILKRQREALAASLLFAFFPAVWLHTGVPLSDPAGLAAGLSCAWLWMRARRTPVLLPVAALLFGVAVSIRPQDAVIALFPLARTLFHAPFRRRVTGLGAAAVSVGVLYFAPVFIAGGGFAGPWRVFRFQTNYLMSTDSLLAPGRLVKAVLGKYLLDIWATWPFAIFITILAAYGVFLLFRTRRQALLELAGAFVPYLVLCWLVMDPSTGGRYSLPYLPLVAVTVAVAATHLEERFVARRVPVVVALAMAWPAVVMWPAIRVIHTRSSPPVAAAEAIRQKMGQRPFGIVFDPGLYPQAQWLFPKVPMLSSEDLVAGRRVLDRGRAWWRFGVSEEGSSSAARWPAIPAFSRVGRGRYLEVPYGPLTRPPIRFEDGWYGPEFTTSADGAKSEFRWMAQRALMRFSALVLPVRFEIAVRAPLDALRAAPDVQVSINGRVVDRFQAGGEFAAKVYHLPGRLLRSDAPNMIEILSTETFVPAQVNPRSTDRRILALQVRDVSLSFE